MAGKVWDTEEVDLLKALIEEKFSNTEIANELERSVYAVVHYIHRHNLARTLIKTTKEYTVELPLDIKLLSEYIGAHIKIAHKHSCGYVWDIAPHEILKGVSCPKCSKGGFNPALPGQVYLIIFKEINLYKIGLSNKYKKRIREFGLESTLILVREFEKGSDASKLEKEWLENIKPYKLNTGLLRSGNTETFILNVN